MNICEICLKSFSTGHKGCCSTECYMQILQEKLEECSRHDTSHTKLLVSSV